MLQLHRPDLLALFLNVGKSSNMEALNKLIMDSGGQLETNFYPATDTDDSTIHEPEVPSGETEIGDAEHGPSAVSYITTRTGGPTFSPPNSDGTHPNHRCVDLDKAIMALSIHYIGASQDERRMAFKRNATFILEFYVAITENLDVIRTASNISGYHGECTQYCLVAWN